MSVRKSDDDKYEARLIRATWDEMCRDDLQYFANSNNLDCLTARLLLEFQDAFLVGIEDPFEASELKPHATSIRKMGRIFENFRLAKYVKRTGFAWRPRKVLKDILRERLRPNNYSFPGDEKRYNADCISGLQEIANVLQFISSVLSALDLKIKKGFGQYLGELLASTSVKPATGSVRTAPVLRILERRSESPRSGEKIP
jgi:hypothetical protein